MKMSTQIVPTVSSTVSRIDESKIRFENYIDYSKLFFYLGALLAFIEIDNKTLSIGMLVYSMYLLLRAFCVGIRVPYDHID